MNLSPKILRAKNSQKCEAALLLSGSSKAKTLVVMHHYVWVNAVATERASRH